MKKNVLIIGALAVVMSGGTALAHEGHDHDKPASVQAQKGGEIKSLDNVHVEVKPSGKDLMIYLFNKDLTPANGADYKVTAKAETTRPQKISKELDLKPSGNSYQASFDAKGARYFKLTVSVVDPKLGAEASTVTFNIEPKTKK